jgi:dienelactone hydrolase
MLASLRQSLLICVIALISATSIGATSNGAQDLNASLNEQVLSIPKHDALSTTYLETTLYKPNSAGPFPVVVINHGKSGGDTRFQSRYRPTSAARFFLQRGYAVVVPMRQGFSKSEGGYVSGGCNVESNGLVQAQDVKATLDYVTSQPWADKSRIVVMGQSHGGWTTLAFGTQNYPGVVGLVNFAGGLRQENCTSWEGTLARAAGAYGKETKQPSLWFYGDNDSYFSTYTFKSMHEKYVAAGGVAELIDFGVFGKDAHAMFGSYAGELIWQPHVEAFLRRVGMPVAIVHSEFQRPPTPPATHFADVDDVEKVPYLKAKGREGYKTFLGKQMPRAFALSSSGAWAWAEMGADPMQQALDNCNRHTTQPCRLYAVDDKTVW